MTTSLQPRLGFTPAEVAAMLGSTPCAVRAQIRRGRIPAHRIGPRNLLVPAEWVERLRQSDEAGR